MRPWAAIARPGRRTPNPKERQVSTRPIRRKERSFNDEIYQHGPFGTIYCHLRRYPVGAHSVRPGSAKSYGSWANNVRPYGSAGADEFTNGVPRSYPKAPSLVALPQQSESTTGRAGTRVAVRLWDCTSQSRQARAQSEGKNGHSMMKSTCTDRLLRYIAICDVTS